MQFALGRKQALPGAQPAAASAPASAGKDSALGSTNPGVTASPGQSLRQPSLQPASPAPARNAHADAVLSADVHLRSDAHASPESMSDSSRSNAQQPAQLQQERETSSIQKEGGRDEDAGGVASRSSYQKSQQGCGFRSGFLLPSKGQKQTQPLKASAEHAGAAVSMNDPSNAIHAQIAWENEARLAHMAPAEVNHCQLCHAPSRFDASGSQVRSGNRRNHDCNMTRLCWIMLRT